MNRQEFLYQLAAELTSLPPEERIAALKYYEEYFEDAGPEKEREVLEELGSPQDVARTILGDYARREPGQGPGGWGGPGGGMPPPSQAPIAPKPERNPWRTVLIIFLVLFFGWPLLAAAFGLAVGLLGAILGGAIGLLGAFVGLLAGGVAAIVRGVFVLVTAPASGLLQIGGGLVMAGVGLFICILGAWLAVWAVPRFIRWAVSLVRRLLRIDGGGNGR